MILELTRKYHPDGTNGKLTEGTQLICHTIELPWLDNQINISCIPEGCYLLKKRWTKSRGYHLTLEEVAGRTSILFHAANNATKELKGCIAPVSQLTGKGLGIYSRRALNRLHFYVMSAFELEEEVRLIIQS